MYVYAWMGDGREVAQGWKEKGMSGAEVDEECRRGDGIGWHV